MPPAPNVQLREVQSTDLPIFFRQQSDEVATQMAAFRPRDEAAFYPHWEKVLANPEGVVRAIVADGEVAGNVLCFRHAENLEVGYLLGRDYWGRGIATRALQLFLCLVSTRPLYAGVAKRNPASLRVLQKCGFVITGEETGPGDREDAVVEFHLLELRDPEADPRSP